MTTPKKLIEMVCTGNQGRSPVAELVGNNYLAAVGASDYACISSGTMVSDFETGNLTIPIMIHTIDIARTRGMYSAEQHETIDKAIKDGDTVAVKTFFNYANTQFSHEEHTFRTEAIPELGIEGRIKTGRDQTIARSDTVAVFSMAGSNNRQVEAIYAASETRQKPAIIDVLSAYATKTPGREIPNAYGKDKDAYRGAIIAIVEHVPLAIDRLLREN